MNIAKIHKQYEENQDRNFHSENAMLLAKHFGSKEDKIMAKRILEKHTACGSIPRDAYHDRQELDQRLYKVMMGMLSGTKA